jgi:hypothetical protein
MLNQRQTKYRDNMRRVQGKQPSISHILVSTPRSSSEVYHQHDHCSEPSKTRILLHHPHSNFVISFDQKQRREL